MSPYYLMFLNSSLLIYIVFSMRINIKIFRIVPILVYTVILAFFTTQRDFEYGDTGAYYDYYMFKYEYLTFEPLFELLNWAFRQFLPNNPTFYFFSVTFMSAFLVHYSLYKLFDYHKALILIWSFSSFYTFYYFNFETIRDGLAFGILFYAFTFFIKREEIFKYLFFVIVSSMIHYTYLLFIFLPLFKNLENKIWIFILLLLTYFSSTILMSIIASLDPSLGVIINKVIFYQEMTSESKTLLVRNLFFISFLFFVWKNSPTDNYTKIYLFLIFLLAFSLPFDEINRRFLFKGTLLVLIPIVFFVFKHQLVKPFVFLIWIYFNLFLVNYNAMYGLLNYEPIFHLSFK